MCAFSLLAVVLPMSTAAPGPIVHTTYGPIEGLQKDGYRQFTHVPFALPPVDHWRFQAPQPPTPWTHALKAVNPSPSCTQLDFLKGLRVGQEDCLYLDVTIPDNCTPETPCPVMQWIYGGAWILGQENEFNMYNQTHLALNHSVIVVAANYRLDVLGWIALPELAEEDPHHRYGNMGLLDQQEAIRWTNKNIKAFGGDPNRVTIFGESAGGWSVCQHLGSPGSNRLFSNAIIQSASCDTQSLLIFPGQDAQRFGHTYAKAVGCDPKTTDVLACMRGLSLSQLLLPYVDWLNPNWPFTKNSTFLSDKQNTAGLAQWPKPVPGWAPFAPWAAVIDNVTLPASPYHMFERGHIPLSPLGNPVNVIMGSDADEGTLFMLFTTVVVRNLSSYASFGLYTDLDVSKMIQDLVGYNPQWPEDADKQIIAAYPKKNYREFIGTNIARVADVISDMLFTCAIRRAARELSSKGVNVYMYHFEHKFDGYKSVKSCGPGVFALCGDFHGSEVGFVWQDKYRLEGSAKDKKMTEDFAYYWINMAKYGSPNAPNREHGDPIFWPTYNFSSKSYIVLKEPGLEIGYDLKPDTCDVFDGLD